VVSNVITLIQNLVKIGKPILKLKGTFTHRQLDGLLSLIFPSRKESRLAVEGDANMPTHSSDTLVKRHWCMYFNTPDIRLCV
jgi:hypothetical protein